MKAKGELLTISKYGKCYSAEERHSWCLQPPKTEIETVMTAEGGS